MASFVARCDLLAGLKSPTTAIMFEAILVRSNPFSVRRRIGLPRQRFPKHYLGLGLGVSQATVKGVRLRPPRLTADQRLHHSVLDRPRLNTLHEITANSPPVVSLIGRQTADLHTPIRLQKL